MSANLIRSSIRRHGLLGTLWRALAATGRMARRVPYLRERHVWYRLDLDSGRPRRELPPGFEVARGGVKELSLLEPLKTVGYVEGLRRLGDGVDFWLIRKDGEAAFACWVYRGRVPVLAAPGGWLDLPDGIACREDSITAPAYRGSGLAAVSYTPIADSLAREGFRAVITKIAEANAPARRAVEKAGLRPVATMSLVRIGWMRWVEVKVVPGEEDSLFLDFPARNRSGRRARLLPGILARSAH